ncbi:MAG: hypothetical protein WC373_14700 [Smithella sp.]|jgi:hypothetical protein
MRILHRMKIEFGLGYEQCGCDYCGCKKVDNKGANYLWRYMKNNKTISGLFCSINCMEAKTAINKLDCAPEMEPYKAEDVIPIVAKMNGPSSRICKNCIYFCDQDSERPRISAWCGNDESKHYCLDIKETDTCEDHRRDGE